MRLAKQQAEGLARSLGLTRATRFINVLEAGVMNNTSNEAPPQRGYEIELTLPLFDWGEAKVARAEAIYMQAVENVRATALRARSEAREAYLRYRTAFDLARHYRDEIIPLRKYIGEQNVLRYNGMLMSVFELSGAKIPSSHIPPCWWRSLVHKLCWCIILVLVQPSSPND
ncbi:MAG: TolC family protein [Halothiobacillaceae bacterium]